MARVRETREYYLKFSTPTTEQPPSLTSLANDVDDFVLVQNDAKPPAVILLGWAGCLDKHLAKYGTIYSEKGCVTLRCAAPLEFMFLRRGKMRALGRRVLDDIMDLNLNEHPIFFHVFSNGGAYLYKHVALAMQERAAPVKVLGVIWDSSPGVGCFRSMYLAFKAIMESRWPLLAPSGTGVSEALGLGAWPLWPGLASPIALALAMVMTAWWLVEVLLQSMTSLRPQPLDPLAELDNVPTAYTGAHLFLYSPADELILAQDVERFAGHRRGMGELVTAVRFEDSAHVQHYLAHRETYTEAVYSFMRDVLSGRRPSPS